MPSHPIVAVTVVTARRDVFIVIFTLEARSNCRSRLLHLSSILFFLGNRQTNKQTNKKLIFIRGSHSAWCSAASIRCTSFDFFLFSSPPPLLCLLSSRCCCCCRCGCWRSRRQRSAIFIYFCTPWFVKIKKDTNLSAIYFPPTPPNFSRHCCCCWFLKDPCSPCLPRIRKRQLIKLIIEKETEQNNFLLCRLFDLHWKMAKFCKILF